jgi:hypothetical protein
VLAIVVLLFTDLNVKPEDVKFEFPLVVPLTLSVYVPPSLILFNVNDPALADV